MNTTYTNEDQLRQTVRALVDDTGRGQMCHLHLGSEPLPQAPAVAEIISLCRSIIFPGFFGGEDVNSFNLPHLIGTQCDRLLQLLQNQVLACLYFAAAPTPCGCGHTGVAAQGAEALAARAEAIATAFVRRLPAIRATLHTDVDAMYVGDPAAVSHEEVIYCYPAIKAITNYRIAHELLLSGVGILPRMITEAAHSETGIDIHPGATIGERFAIDHGTGVVIGQTAIIGHDVKLYQGVTLGAKSFDLDEHGNPVKDVPRHPIIGNHVVIYSNASILGRITIGDGAVVGGNVWVTADVAPGEMVLQARRGTGGQD